MKVKRDSLFYCILTAVILSLILCSCGSSSNNAKAEDGSPDEGYYYQSSPSASNLIGGGFDAAEEDHYGELSENTQEKTEQQISGAVERKRIRNVSLDVETKEFDQLIDSITDTVNSLGGYIENSYIQGNSIYYEYRQNRYSTVTARIPAEKLDTFLKAVSNLCHITSRSESVNDITDSYYDTSARITNLEAQEARLRELLQQASSMEDILTIESKLSEVRYQIDSLTGTLNRYDNLVAYSTIYIHINEVTELSLSQPTTISFGERLKNAFVRSGRQIRNTVEDMIISIIVSGPVFILWLIIIIIIILILRFILIKIIKFRKSDAPRKRLFSRKRSLKDGSSGTLYSQNHAANDAPDRKSDTPKIDNGSDE